MQQGRSVAIKALSAITPTNAFIRLSLDPDLTGRHRGRIFVSGRPVRNTT